MGTKVLPHHRKHTCTECSTEWYAPVVLTNNTVSLSGEKSTFCPKCKKRSQIAGPASHCIADQQGFCRVCRSYVGA